MFSKFSELPKFSTFKPFLKSQHVKMCSEILQYTDVIWFNTILNKTCPDLLKYYDTIWYDSTNMSRLVEMIWHDSKNMLRLV